MKTRLGIVLATSALIGAGACASGGGSTEGTASPTANTPGVETLDPGEAPVENEHTEAADNHLEQANEALEEGDEGTARTHFQAAAESAEQAIAMQSNNPLPWFQGGLANIGLGNYVAADSMLVRAEDLRPLYGLDILPLREEQWLELYNQAAPLINQAEYEAAAELLENAHVMYQERPEVMLILGQIWAQQGRYEDAIPLLEQGLEAVRSDEMREGADEETLASWDQQAAGVPVVLAQSLVNAERYEEGVELFRELLAEDPDNLEYRQTLANVFVQMEMPDSAAAIYNDLLNQPGMSAEGMYQLGIGLYQIEQYGEAATAFQRATTEAPRDRDAAEMWARSLQMAHPPGEEEGAGTPEATLEELLEASELWLELDPYSQNAYIITAQTANRLGDVQRANELIGEADLLPVIMEDLQIQVGLEGGAAVRGMLRNSSMEPGATVTVEFTFFGDGTTPLGSESITVELPAVDANQSFEVVLESQEPIRGYTYSIEGV